MTELASAGLEARQAHERIALPVPTWSVETWLLALLGEADLSESASYKTAFPPTGRDESQALDNAAAQWANASTIAQQLPSLADGAIEIARLLQP
ncbi:MAG: hypothetical protein KC609_08530 [Myxococcales bacterium]|nr:hypothetical protein [Myxococcales bacterium]